MTMGEQSVAVDSSAALKAAKKILKNQDSGTIKFKTLAKHVAAKLGCSGDVKMVKKCISASNKFTVDNNKLVSLTKNRKRLAETKLEQPSKKNKREEDDGKQTVTLDEKSASKWRQQHKIVLMDARDTEEGKKATKEFNSKSEYFPDTSFDMVRRENGIAPVLIKQCTKGNGFTRPTPIQAQCWPVLLHSLNGKKHDVVGIAETGR